MKEKFIKALENNDIDEMRKVPKSDLHNHATKGGSRKYIEEWAGISLNSPKAKFKDLEDMQQWHHKNLIPIFEGTLGYEKRIEAAFVQAKDDGVKVLNMNISLGEVCYYDNSVENLVKALKRIHKTFAPDIIFLPEIALNTLTPIKTTEELLEQFISQNYFKSMDMYGDEFYIPSFKKIFRKGKENGLILKAHVGEFGDAELIRKAVEELELDQVQHGIAATNSESVMKYLSYNKIQLNVCPTSNVMLSRVEDYNVHPIRKLYDNGIKVTINTDDMLIFDQSVSEEFFNLYNAGVFNSTELNEIRKNGLSVVFNA
jgi:adenosine deaminase